MSVREIVLAHLGACERDADGAFWCTTHESLLRGPDCTAMLDALDLAEVVAEKLTPARTHPTRGREYALRLNCEKNGCIEKFGWKHEDDGDIRMMSLAQFWQDRWESARINGHDCDKMTREVLFGIWTVEL